MVRPTLIDQLSDQKRALAANMFLRGEPFDLILKYTDQEEGLAIRKGIQQLAEDVEQEMPDPIYYLNLELAQTDLLINVAFGKAENGSPRHMTEYTKMSAHKIKLIQNLTELEELEESKGRSWVPLYDVESIEFRVFEASIDLYLSQIPLETDDFDNLSTENQARFFKILAESE